MPSYRAVVATLGLLLLSMLPAAAAERAHVVTEVHMAVGAAAPTVTLPNGRPAPLAVHQTLPDGARIDVPLRVTVVIASSGGKSTTTLRPDTSFTLISTGAGERSRIAHGSALFSVVHGALSFFQVKYGNAFTASARGTVFSFDSSGKKVTFACLRGRIDVAYASTLQIGAKEAASSQLPEVRTVDVVAAGGPAITFATDAPDRVRRFGSVAEAQAEFEAELARAKLSGDRERLAAAHNNLGTVATAQGEYDRAVRAFDEATLLDPLDAVPHYNRGNAFYRKGDLARAIASYTEAIRLDPDFASAYTNRGAAYDDTGDHDRAITDYDAALRLNPHARFTHYDRANAYKAKHDYARAIADYTRALELDPTSAETYYNRGLARSDAGDDVRAIVDYTTAIRLRPGYQLAYNNRGVSYDTTGDHASALADYERAVALDPTDAIAYGNRAVGLRRKGEYDRAAEDFLAAGDRVRAVASASDGIAAKPSDALAYDLRGLGNLYGGPLDQARADLEKAASLSPGDAFTALLVEVAGRRAGVPSHLAGAATNLDMTAWPAPIVRLFLGTGTAESMFAAARNGDPVERRSHQCNANFYAAEYALLNGARADALPLYRLAARECPDQLGRATARAALKALGESP